MTICACDKQFKIRTVLIRPTVTSKSNSKQSLIYKFFFVLPLALYDAALCGIVEKNT